MGGGSGAGRGGGGGTVGSGHKVTREGEIRTKGRGPLFGTFNLEVYFRGEWVHFGSLGNLAVNDNDFTDAYRALAQRLIDKLCTESVRWAEENDNGH